MSDEPGCCLIRNTEDKCVRLRRHLQVKLPNQPIDRRRSVRLVSINLAGQPFARTVLLAHRQHWLNVDRREWSKQQRARLKRHHSHHCLPNEIEISHSESFRELASSIVRCFHSPLIDRMNPGRSFSRFYRIRKSREMSLRVHRKRTRRKRDRE